MKRGAPRWLGRPIRAPEVAVARAEPAAHAPEPAAHAPEPAAHAPEPPPSRAFDDDDERFFLAEDSLAPTEMPLSALLDEDEPTDARLAGVDSPKRRAFARYVGAVVVLALGMCVAAFTHQANRSITAAEPKAAAEAKAAAGPVAAAEPAPAPRLASPPVAFTAERTPEAVPTVDPRAAHDARELARRALERGDLARAVSSGIESVELDPTDAEAWLVLGAAEMASGKAREARATFAACTKLARRGPRHECAQMLQ